MSSSDRTASQFTEQVALLTPAEVAGILRVTPRTVCRYAHDGRLKRVKIGTRLSRYTRESVTALIDAEHASGMSGLGEVD